MSSSIWRERPERDPTNRNVSNVPIAVISLHHGEHTALEGIRDADVERSFNVASKGHSLLANNILRLSVLVSKGIMNLRSSFVSILCFAKLHPSACLLPSSIPPQGTPPTDPAIQSPQG